MSISLQFLVIVLLCCLPSCCSQFELAITLHKYHHVHFYISPLKGTLGTNLNLSIAYSQASLTNTSNSVTIYSSSFSQTEQTFKYSIWNFQNTDQLITISVSASDVNLTDKIVRMGQMESKSIITAAFDKQTSSGYMLPFNMFNSKISSIYVIQYNATLEKRLYNLQPFMSTYWNQISSSIQVFPHFPYLSQCTIQKSYIILNDLIEPQNCEFDSFYGISCKDKQVNFNCIMEQLQTSNVDSQFWFNKDQQILFYLFKKQLTMEEFSQTRLTMQQTNRLITNVFEDIVPVVYYRKSTDPIVANQFNIEFKVRMDTHSDISIVSAEITGYFNKDIASPNAIFHTHVIYQDMFQRFYSYDLPIYYYITYALLLDCVMMGSIWLITSNIFMIDMRRKIESILTPALKGCLFTILAGGSFFFVLNQITFQTNFNALTSLYGDELTDQSLQLNNIGRNGLMAVFIGFYLLNTSIKQSFKITQDKDLKNQFEDDLKLNQNRAIKPDEVAKLTQKVQFTIKNMVSHKKYILISSIIIIFFSYFCVEIMVSLPNFTLGMLIIFLLPFVSKIFIQLLRFFISKQLLYVCGYVLGFILFFTVLILKNKNISEFTFLYFCKYINLYIQIYLCELLFDKSMKKIDELSEQSLFFKFLSKIFSIIIDSKRKESEYQKSLYLSSIIILQMLGTIMTPIICLTMFIISRNSILESTLLIEQVPMYNTLAMVVVLVPMEIYTIFSSIELLKKYGFRIEEVIRFNRFKYQRRRFKFIIDLFSHSPNINWFFREYQKFSFSSYLYYGISLLGYSIFLIFIGMIVIIESNYSFVYDPAMLIIAITVFVSGDILYFAFSYLAVKNLKLYEKRDVQFMRQNLNKTEKYLKNNDANDFLDLEGVKEYFIQYKKDWIVQNLHRIFQRQDLEQNNGQIIAKYKHYKSLFKKKEIQNKRKLKQLKQTTQNNHTTQLIQQNKIILNKKIFLLTKPIMYYWLYLSKQNLYLKNIVNCVRSEKIKKNCQFCNMDFELQALQRRDFQQLVNQYRVLNVNKFFDPQTFLEFYRLNQKYITICIQCKQKNLHLRNQFTMKQISSKLVKKWHLIAKSMILHRKAQDK